MLPRIGPHTYEQRGYGHKSLRFARIPIAIRTMERHVIGFHQDENGDWVADLECGHTQHVLHNPPWQQRPWVTTEEGRANFIGHKLICKKCVENSPTTS